MKAKRSTIVCTAAALFFVVAGAAAAQVGRQVATGALALTEAEITACGQGDQTACRKGYEYYKAQSDMGSAHLTHNPRAAGQIDADYGACTGGSRQACTAFAAQYRAHIAQAPNRAGTNPVFQENQNQGAMPTHR